MFRRGRRNGARVLPDPKRPKTDSRNVREGWLAGHPVGPWPRSILRLALPPLVLSDEPMQTVTYQLTVPDLVDARAHVYNRLPFVRAVRAIPFILVSGCLLYGAFAASQRDWEGVAASVGWLAVGLALIVWMYVANKWLLPGSARKQLAGSRELQGDMVVRWDRTAISFESRHGKSGWPWSDFSRWQETPGNLLLWRSDRLYNCLPKRTLTNDQIAELRQHLRQALGEP